MLAQIKNHPYYSASLSLLLIYAIAGFFLVPYLLEKTLTETLREDFSAELSVEKIEVNPFVLSLRVNNLAVNDPGGKTTFRVEEVFANLQLSSIFRLALTLDAISIKSPELFVSRDSSGELDLAYLMQTSRAENSRNDSKTAVDGELFPLLISQFSIADFVVHWSDEVPAEPVATRFGPMSVDIKDFNTLPERVGEQTVVIATDNLGTLSWSGDLQLNPLRSSARATLEGASFDLLSAYIRNPTGIDIVNGTADLALDYEVLQTADGDIRATVENFAMGISDLVINSFADGTGFDFAGVDQQILGLPEIKISGGKMQWPQQTVSISSVVIRDPQIDTTRDERGVFNLQAAEQTDTVAKIETAEAAETGSSTGHAATASWQVAIENFSIENLLFNLTDRSVSPATRLGLQAFNLTVTNLNNTPRARFPTTLSLQAQSGGSVQLNGEISVLPQPVIDFDMVVDNLALGAANPYINQFVNLDLESGEINLQAKIASTAEEPFAYNGNLEVVNLEIVESINRERLASWKRFLGDNISLSIAQQRLDISQLRVEQLYSDILIDQNGTLNLGQVAKPPADETAAQKGSDTAVEQEAPRADDDTDKKPGQQDTADFKIQIGGVTVNNASADFADLSLPLPFAVKIEELNGKITTISNQSTVSSGVEFEGKVDDYGFARVSGNVTPLQPEKNTDIQLAFENIDVPKFTPYTIPFAGREIASGTLDLTLGYQIKDGEMVGDNSMILRDFELGKEIPHPDALDIPLGLAVALLKDPSGKIDIDLPVSGNVNDPEFSYTGIIWRSLGNLLVKIVLSPFNLLGNLLGIEASELENINFIAGRADLTPPEVQRSEKLAEALSLRPQLQLVINGVYDEAADSLALRKTQLEQRLELEIARLSEAGDPSIQYPEHRRTALENLLNEQLGNEAATLRLAELQANFTSQQIVEGQSDPLEQFDDLAYTAAINQQLIELQELDVNALQQLAEARANSLQTALISIDEKLQSRLLTGEIKTVTQAEDKAIQMPVSLNAGS